jgi:hypothetical protein
LCVLLTGCSGNVAGVSPQGSGGDGQSSGGFSTQGTGGQQNVGGAGGTTGQPGTATIGGLISDMNQLVMTINISDGFIRYENDTYTLDLATGHLTYEHVVRDATGSATSTDALDATPAQVADLVSAVKSIAWRQQPSCMSLAIDGGAYPPKLTVVSGSNQTVFGVSSATCGSSDHSASGKVMTCAAFDGIFAMMTAIRPGGASPGCPSYW